MGFNFEKLKVWGMAVEHADDVNKISRKFPKEELFSLTSQFRRATDSISLNIAEGATDNTKPEFKRFLTLASRSCAEVITCLYHSKNRKYIRTHLKIIWNLKFMNNPVTEPAEVTVASTSSAT